MRNPTTQLRLREYLRVSEDKSGRERSNEEQHDENVTFAGRHGATIGGLPYRDVGSASRYATKARGDFDKLVADLRANRIPEDGLLMWESSRGSRRAGEWATLLDLCEDRGKLIAVTTHDRIYDPANPRDRRSLMEDAVDSEYESGKTSLRIRRNVAANAAAGLPHGHVPFGYERHYDLKTRRFIEQVEMPDEAKIVREIFDRLAAGHSLKAVARWLAEEGITSRKGIPFSSETLRNLALNPAYIGKRRHAPGAKTDAERRRSATLVDAVWEGIVDEAVWHAVYRRLTDPARTTARPGRGVHLLSMIALCDVCGGPLAATMKNNANRRGYQCHRSGHLRVVADDLDELATHTILTALADPKIAARLTATDDADVAEADAEVERIRKELDDLEVELGDGLITARMAGRSEARIERRLNAALDRREALRAPDDLTRLMKPGPGVVARWKAAPMSTKREVARMLFTPSKLGELRVTRRPKLDRPQELVDRVVWNREA